MWSITSSSDDAEPVDVLAVERRDERLVQLAHDRVGRLVAGVLAARIFSAIVLAVGRVGAEQLLEQAGAVTRFRPDVANMP